MIQMILEKPERRKINETKGLIIKRSNERLKSLLFEAIESSRFDKIFNFNCEGRCTING